MRPFWYLDWASCSQCRHSARVAIRRAFSHLEPDMERTKPKPAGWRSFRFGYESDKKKPDEEEHRHTPETRTNECIGVGCYCTTIDADKLDQN